MSEEQDMSTQQKAFEEFQKDFPEKIVVPADNSPSALLPPEEIVLIRDSPSKSVVYKGKMSLDFRPASRETDGNGANGNGNPK